MNTDEITFIFKKRLINPSEKLFVI